MNKNKIIFSDLDGTLLDHFTYSFDESKKGLELLKEKSIPLIMVSSKTFFEMNSIRMDLQIEYPFIFENGAGVSFPDFEEKDIHLFGLNSASLLKKVPVLEKELGKKIRTFFEMTVNEVAERTGLPLDRAEAAKKRLGTMPFVIDSDISLDEIESVNNAIKSDGISITKGGRFYHLMSENISKGHAALFLIDFIRNKNNVDNIETMAVGDSLNDVPLLKVVDFPCLVKRHDDSYVKVDFKVKHINDIGPRGFSKAVEKFLNR